MADPGRRSTRFSVRSKQLGQLLVESNDVTPDQVAKALKRQEQQGGMLGYILQDMGACHANAIAAALLKQVQVTDIRAEEIQVPADVAAMLDRAFCETKKICPFERIGNMLCVVMANPLDSKAKVQVEEVTHLKVKAFKAPWPKLSELIQRTYDNLSAEGEAAPEGDYQLPEGEAQDGGALEMPPAFDAAPAAEGDDGTLAMPPAFDEAPVIQAPQPVAPPQPIAAPRVRRPEAPPQPRVEGLDNLDEASAEVIEVNRRGLTQKRRPQVQEEPEEAPRPKVEKKAKINVDLDQFDQNAAAEVVATGADAHGADDGMEEIAGSPAPAPARTAPAPRPAAARSAAPARTAPVAAAASTEIHSLTLVADAYFYAENEHPEGGREDQLDELLATLPVAETIAANRAAYDAQVAAKQPVLKSSGERPLEYLPAPVAPVDAVPLTDAEFQRFTASLEEDPVGEWDSQFVTAGPVPASVYEEN